MAIGRQSLGSFIFPKAKLIIPNSTVTILSGEVSFGTASISGEIMAPILERMLSISS